MAGDCVSRGIGVLLALALSDCVSLPGLAATHGGANPLALPGGREKLEPLRPGSRLAPVNPRDQAGQALEFSNPLLHVPQASEFGFLPKSDTARSRTSPAASHKSQPATASPADASSPEIVLDGTLGPSGPLTASNGIYTITSDMGQIHGPNLFHSFSQFNLAAGETASFSGPSSIQNVLARVTGGSASNINGTLQCTIANANFFFMNPSGITFAASGGSSLNLEGSFALTTADYVRFSDNTRFAATGTGTSASLSSAAPAAFGFLATSPAGINVQGTLIQAPDGNALLAVAGPIQLNAGALYCSSGRIGVVSVASSGQVTFDSTSLAVTGITNPMLGTVALMSDAAIASNGLTGGSVSISCNTLSVNGGSAISSFLNGFGAGGKGITINVTGQLSVSGYDSTGLDSAITADAEASATGKGENVSITANTLQLTNGAYISTNTFGLANGGRTTVAVSDAATLSGADAGNFGSGIFAEAHGAGNAGDVMFSTGNLKILNGAQIDANTYSAGNGGNVDILVGQAAVLDAQGYSADLVGIAAISNPGATGSAGNVKLSASSLQMLNGAEINAVTSGAGSGGNISINVTGNALISGANGANQNSGVYVSSGAAGAGGQAGNITFNAANLTLQNGGTISSSTFGLANGDNVTVSVPGTLLITGESPAHLDSGILAVSINSGQGGKAGNISISAGSLTLQGGGKIDSSTQGQGMGGDIGVKITGSTLITGEDSQQTDSAILATSTSIGQGGNAGNISFSGGNLNLEAGGTISSATSGLGNGGTISLTCGGSLLCGGASSISADTYGAGKGGQIVVSTPSLTLVDQGIITALATGHGDAGSLVVNTSGGVISIVGDGNKDTVTGMSVQTSMLGPNAGSAGAIDLMTGQLLLSNSATILAATIGGGAGGRISIGANQVMLSGGSGVDVLSVGNGNAGVISVNAQSINVANSSILATTSAAGNGGDVILSGASILLHGNSAAIGSYSTPISGGSVTMGDAGSVKITASQSLMLQAGSVISTQAVASTGGDISISATDLSLDSGSIISATALRAGSVTINSPTISLNGGSAISTDTVASSPNGSDVSLLTVSLSIDGSTISAKTTGSGKGGDIQIGPTVGNDSLWMSLTNGATISASADSGSTGAGGNIVINPSSFSERASQVTASSSGSGKGGSVSVASKGGLNVGDHSSISATGNSHAGNVNLTASDGLSITESNIETSAPMTGNGGNIEVHSLRGDLSIKNAQIDATAGQQADVTITAANVVSIAASTIDAAATNPGNTGGGRVTIDPQIVLLKNSFIDATSNGAAVPVVFGTGVPVLRSDTTIKTQQLVLSPTVDLTGGLTPLPGGLLSPTAKLEPQCTLIVGGQFSSFIVTGREGQPPEPGGLLPEMQVPDQAALFDKGRPKRTKTPESSQ